MELVSLLFRRFGEKSDNVSFSDFFLHKKLLVYVPFACEILRNQTIMSLLASVCQQKCIRLHL